MPAPYSDNLYSNFGDDGSDDEQNSALSPTDGYFHASSSTVPGVDTASPPLRYQYQYQYQPQTQPQHQRQSSNVPSVPNVLVEDPTLNQDKAAAKEREAAQERLLLNNSTSSQSNVAQTHSYHSPISSQSHHQQSSTSAASSSNPTSPHSHHHRRSVEEQNSSFIYSHSAASPTSPHYSRHHPHSDAPPAYSPSASSPSHSAHYQTFGSLNNAVNQSTMGVPEEHQALLPRHPESMGAPGYGSRTPFWRRIKDSAQSSHNRKALKSLLGVLVILSIVFILVSSITGLGSHYRAKPGIIDKSPVKKPVTTPTREMKWNPGSVCLNKPQKLMTITEKVTFGTGEKLAVLQKVNRDVHRYGHSPHVFGEVILKPIEASSEGSIDLEVISNIDELELGIHFDRKSQQFNVVTPQWIDWSEAIWTACIQLRITVSIPTNSNLQSINIEAIQLNVHINDGLTLGSLQSAIINTVSGNVGTGSASGDVAPYTLASRNIIIESVSGDVRGWFPLYDLLKIGTASGDVTTDVTPKPSSDKHPEPAVLDISSLSGDLVVREGLDQAREKLPIRNYIARMSTASGRIEGNLVFSSEAKFGSQSGDFKLQLLPVLSTDAPKPQLSTDTKSGRSDVTVLEPLFKGEGEPHLALTSKHNSVSGNVNLAYPSSWDGKFSMTTMSGSQTVRGDGLKYGRAGGFIRRIEGSKGDGSSDLKVESISGNEIFYVGNK
ncbi:hypothetical protein PT974_10136 [Cladobotryum mycophilum]|uniref:Adhesin domain-containing protein n=1 Tax=Cladobotryum mycophilum TaxID=491253 RepID=A0ABR0SA37_9HYPO